MEEIQIKKIILASNSIKKYFQVQFEKEKEEEDLDYDDQYKQIEIENKREIEAEKLRQRKKMNLLKRQIKFENRNQLKVFKEALKCEKNNLHKEIQHLPQHVAMTRHILLKIDQNRGKLLFIEALEKRENNILNSANNIHQDDLFIIEKHNLEKKHKIVMSKELALAEIQKGYLRIKHGCNEKMLTDIISLKRNRILERQVHALQGVHSIYDQIRKGVSKDFNTNRIFLAMQTKKAISEDQQLSDRHETLNEVPNRLCSAKFDHVQQEIKQLKLKFLEKIKQVEEKANLEVEKVENRYKKDLKIFDDETQGQLEAQKEKLKDEILNLTKKLDQKAYEMEEDFKKKFVHH